MQTALISIAEQRVVNFRFLINQLQRQSMTLREVAALLDFSLSGARKYLRLLLNAGLVAAEAGAHSGIPAGAVVYRWMADAEAAELFLKNMHRAVAELSLTGRCPPAGAACPPLVGGGARSSRPACAGASSAANRDPLVAALFGAPRGKGG